MTEQEFIIQNKILNLKYKEAKLELELKKIKKIESEEETKIGFKIN